jgi:catechol 2,3-dioxygenase-like lactoylglutathione lyase family enzyme
MVKDAARAIAFYRDVLGLEPTLVYPNDAGAEYEFADGTTFGLWSGGGMMPFQPSSGNLFAVDDFDGAVSALKKRGIPVIMEHETDKCFSKSVPSSIRQTWIRAMAHAMAICVPATTLASRAFQI